MVVAETPPPQTSSPQSPSPAYYCNYKKLKLVLHPQVPEIDKNHKRKRKNYKTKNVVRLFSLPFLLSLYLSLARHLDITASVACIAKSSLM